MCTQRVSLLKGGLHHFVPLLIVQAVYLLLLCYRIKLEKIGVVQHTKAEHSSTLNTDFCRILVRRESYYEKSMLWIDLFCIRN